MSDAVIESSTSEKQIYRVMINAPIDKVWSELINTTEPRPFFYGAICDTPALAVGEPYRMVSKDRRNAFVVGRTLAIEPPHLLCQSFKFTTGDDAPCKVTYQLREVEGQVEFSLITENVPVGTRTEKSMAGGGRWITRNMKAFVETGRPTTAGRLMLASMAVLGFATPRAARIENWPLESLE